MSENNQVENSKKIWAVGGGKGGVGKTLFTANLGVGLARKGKKVVVVDCDLGGADLHTLLGIKYVKHNLDDYMRNGCSFDELVVPTAIENLKLICGANGILGSANPLYYQKVKAINCLRSLDADYVIVDLGAGTSYNVLDFLNAADEKIVIFSPEPTSLQNVYGFLKSALYRHLVRTFKDNLPIKDKILDTVNPRYGATVGTLSDLSGMIHDIDKDSHELFLETIEGFRPNTIVNMIKSKGEQNTALGLNLTAKKYLNLEVNYLGYLHDDPIVPESVRAMTPFMVRNPDAQVSNLLNSILDRLV